MGITKQTIFIRLTFTFFFFIFLSFSLKGQISNCKYTTNEFPFRLDENAGWSAGLYDPAQIGGAQTITQIQFRLQTPSYSFWDPYTFNDVQVFVRETDVANYNQPGQNTYPGTSGFTKVFDGSFNFTGGGIHTFSFGTGSGSSSQFNYSGTKNLELLIICKNINGDMYYDHNPAFSRTDPRTDDVRPGKVGDGSNWTDAQTHYALQHHTLAISTGKSAIYDPCNVYPLPVELLGFTAIPSFGKVKLDWSTASETNNDYFTLYRSTDGYAWEEIKQVPGAGNSNIQNDYHYYDRKVLSSEITYYKLRQTDYDGQYEEFGPITVRQDFDEVIIYPNPAKDEITIYSKETFQVYSPTGELISLMPLKDGTFNTSNLSPGIYILYFANGITKKFIKE